MKRMRLGIIFVGLILFLGACQETDNNPNTNNNNITDNADNSSNNENEASANTSENEDIEGTLWDGEGDIGVILSHGAAYDADSWEEQGEELADNGMVAFATEDTAPEELAAAAEMLQDEHDVDEVALLGASAGGASAIDAVTEDDFDFSKAALLSPGGDASSIEDIPVFVAFSEEEGFDDLEDTSVETFSISGGAHAQEMFDEDEGEEIMEKLIDFLSE